MTLNSPINNNNMEKCEIVGYYYQHKNGSLIYKSGTEAIVDIRDSDLCLSAWPWDGSRLAAWNLLVEAKSLGVNNERIDELIDKWSCDDLDADNYASYIGVILGEDGNQKTAKLPNFINLSESHCGFGETYLEAMADLCKQLGYKGGKTWNSTFQSLIKSEQS
jgi:hypothetical protein